MTILPSVVFFLLSGSLPSLFFLSLIWFSLDDGARPSAMMPMVTMVLDVAAMMLVVTKVLGEYWKTYGRVTAGVPLEKGLSLLRKRDGKHNSKNALL